MEDQTKITVKNIDKPIVVFALILVFLWLLVTFQTCSVKARITESMQTIQLKMDSLDFNSNLKLREVRSENTNNQIQTLISIQQLTNAANISNKINVIENQNSVIKKLKTDLERIKKEK